MRSPCKFAMPMSDAVQGACAHISGAVMGPPWQERLTAPLTASGMAKAFSVSTGYQCLGKHGLHAATTRLRCPHCLCVDMRSAWTRKQKDNAAAIKLHCRALPHAECVCVCGHERRAWVEATRVVTTPGTMHGWDTSSAVFSSSTISLRETGQALMPWQAGGGGLVEAPLLR